MDPDYAEVKLHSGNLDSMCLTPVSFQLIQNLQQKLKTKIIKPQASTYVKTLLEVCS